MFWHIFNKNIFNKDIDHISSFVPPLKIDFIQRNHFVSKICYFSWLELCTFLDWTFFLFEKKGLKIYNEKLLVLRL